MITFAGVKRKLLFLALAAVVAVACKKEDDTPSLLPGEVAITSVAIDGVKADYDAAERRFTATLPAVTDFSALSVTIVTEATRMESGGERILKENPQLDLRRPMRIRCIKNGTYQDYSIEARNTGLPVVRIETPGKKAVNSKETWVENASMTIELADGKVSYEGTADIRGRGNSTWNWYPKKPYALRLQEKSEILGMPAHKRWVLLAHWKDRTLMRNDAAFWLSAHSGLPYSVRGQYVQLVLNGKHLGNYYLCEQIKIGKDRVNIEKMEPMETRPEIITGGFLLEVDTYFDEKYQFINQNLFNLPWMVKQPDDDELSGAAFEYIRNWITDLEKLLKDTGRVQAHEYEACLDVDTAIDYLIVEELTGNNDFYNEWPWPGTHSAFFYKERGGKLYHGPVWDFDYHAFCPQFSHVWVGATKTLFYPALLKDQKFRSRLVERWNAQKSALKELPAHIDEVADHIRLSESLNHAQWPIVNNPENGDEEMTFQQAVDRMKKAFLDKWEWMDKNIANLK